MKKTLLLALVFTSMVAAADNFAPTGSIWYYSLGTIDPEYTTYRTFESVKDTTLSGQDCQKIIVSVEGQKEEIQYMFSRNDSVFFWAEDAFHLLYDFGADKGETIILDYFKKASGESLDMTIDSVGSIEINGINKKVQYISCGDGMLIEFPGPVIEGIGSAYYMFPTYDDHLEGALRCYQDNDLGLYKNTFYGGWEKECNYIESNEVPAPTNFYASVEYVEMGDWTDCGGTVMNGPAYCTRMSWSAPDTLSTGLILSGYKLYQNDQPIASIAKSESSFYYCNAVTGDLFITACYTDPEKESNASNTYYVDEDLSIANKKVEAQNKIKVYYNGTSNTIEISNTPIGLYSISIYDINGRTITQWIDNSTTQEVRLNKGIYIVEIRDAEGNRYMKKIMVE